MPDSNRPTSKLPPNRQAPPKPKDWLPWWAGLIAAPVLATIVRLAATRYPAIPQAGLVIGTAAGAIVWRTPFITKKFRGALYGRGRTACTATFLAGNSVAIAGYWPWDIRTVPVLVALLVWVTTVIGGGGNAEQLRERFRMAHEWVRNGGKNSERAAHDADRGLKVFRGELATKFPNAKVSAPTCTSDGFALMVNSDVPIQTATLAWIAGRAYGYPLDDILVADLSYEGRTGTYKVVIGAPKLAQPFSQPLKPRPPVNEWPKGCIPLGEWGDGSVTWVGPEAAVIGGTRGAGKSWLLENFIWGKLTIGYAVRLLDPKRVQFAKYRGVAGCSVASNEQSMLYEITSLVDEMERRFGLMETEGVERWSDMPQGHGPMICLVIDESADLFATVPAARHPVVRLAQKGRAAGVELVLATQYPDKKSIPMEVKANSDVNIALRCSNGTQVNIIKDDREWPLVDPKLPPGMGVLRCSTHPEDWFQTYPSPGIEGLTRFMPPAQPSPPDQPTAPQAPYAGRSTVDPVDSVEVDSTRSTQPEPPTTALDLYAGKDTRTIILEALDHEPITGEALALIAQVSPQAVSKHMQKLLEDGLAKRARGGWVRA